MEWLIGGVALWWFLSQSGASSSSSSDPIFELAVQTAQRAGVDPAILLGIIKVESNWNPSATNLVGADAARGGAYGLTQMTLRTARAFDPTITGAELLDPVTNLRFAGQLLTDNARRGGKEWPDVAAMWNSGRPFDNAPESTRYKYVPRVLAAADSYARDLTLDLGEGDV